MSTEASKGDQPMVWVSFDFVGVHFDPDVITARLGVMPTTQHRAGDPIRPGGAGVRRRDRWRLTVGPTPTFDVSDMVDELIARFGQAKERIPEVCDALDLQAVIICAVEPNVGRSPDITFSRDVVQWAATVGCAVSVDVMVWSEEKNVQPKPRFPMC